MSESIVNSVRSPKESHRDPKAVDLNNIEMVFGTPNSPKTGVQPDAHFIANETKHDKNTHTNNNHFNNGESDTETPPSSQPLLEPPKERNKPPLAGPEIDDLDDEHPTDTTHFPGIDDGLLEPNGKHPELDGGEEKHGDEGSHDVHPTTREDGVGTEDGKWPWPSHDETDFADGFGLESRFNNGDRPISPTPTMPGSTVDVNTYQQKKNLAQGMMDLALLSANANQMRYVLEWRDPHPYYYPSLVLISLSIIFQIAVGIGLILNSRYNVNDDKDICKANKVNNLTVMGVFLITIVNVFITSFSVATPGPAALKNGESDPEEPPSSQPLLEPPTGLPLASPEIDDLDGEHLKNTIQFPDIDDGLLDSNEKPPEPKEGEEEHGVNDSQDNVGGEQDGDGVPELGGRSNFPENTDDTTPRRVDENAYQQRKNLAHGMMDVALMSANANQLRYVLEWRDPHPYYYPSLVLISLSIIFQIAVGIGLILNSRYHENSRDSENEDDKKQHREEMIKANNNNNLILMGVFFITIVNVFITCFSVATPSSAPRAAPTSLQEG